MQVDLDLGASGAIPIKGKYVITGGKQGPLYIADAMNLGGYKPLANNTNVFQVRTLSLADTVLGRIVPVLASTMLYQ